MRIISGIYGGRVINSPRGHITHPMSEKIRGAIFNALGDISGLTLLDAFSGSGAIAIEAASRGIKSVTAIDNSKNAYKAIVENVKSLDITSIKCTRANISSWIENNKEIKFDIIICDPPYDKIDIKLLNKIEKQLSDGGVFIASLPPGINYLSDYNLILEKDYNDAKLYFYRK